jgi:hypothetical protein
VIDCASDLSERIFFRGVRVLRLPTIGLHDGDLISACVTYLESSPTRKREYRGYKNSGSSPSSYSWRATGAIAHQVKIFGRL